MSGEISGIEAFENFRDDVTESKRSVEKATCNEQTVICDKPKVTFADVV